MKKRLSISIVVFVMAISMLGFALNSANTLSTPIQQVQGKVIEAISKKALEGVSVSVEGKIALAFTNEKGYYIISATQVDVLVFEKQGYTTQKVKVTKGEINVSMAGEIPTPPVLTVKEVLQDIEQEEVITEKREYTHYDISANKCADMVMLAPALHYQEAMPNNEEYNEYKENRFTTVNEQPLSTFSIDVDAASYSNMRRYLNWGQMPPKDAIRTEELINYFPYNYPQPKGKDPISITAEVSGCPWNEKHRLVHIGLKAREIPQDKLPASNLVFLIDVSGSMNEPNKLPLLQASMKLLVNQLRDNDQVAIVTYAGNAGLVLPSTQGNQKQKIKAAIDNLSAGGSTAGGAGIKLAYKTAKNNFIKGGNNRIVLATDGDFNVGVSSNDELEKLIENERQTGVFLTILGFGMGNYKDSKMQMLAEKGNGNHAYIDNMNEARKVLVNEFSGTIFTVAKDVKVQIEFNPLKVQAYRLVGYESRMLNKEDFNDDTKDAGEIGAGHSVTALYEIVPVGVYSNLVETVDELKYQQQPERKSIIPLNTSNEMLTIKVRYKEPDKDESQRMDFPLVEQYTPLANTSNNFRFSAAVAEFGMLLRQSSFKANSSYNDVLQLASGAVGEDMEGYRKEFVKLVQSAQVLDR